MFIRLYEKNPDQQVIDQVVKVLKGGGVIVYPTDTIYALGCDMMQPKAIKKMAQLKGIKADKAFFSIIGSSISQLSDYVRLDDEVFKLLKRNLPGAFTFILPTNRAMQKKLGGKRTEIGIRIPNNEIILTIAETLGNPLVTTSIKDEDMVVEYTTDPELIYEKYGNQVEMVINGGYGKNVASTIVNCTEQPFNIERQGMGELK
ncbi:tRNA threonylcarbamoyl adenosine modification protein (Sua5/YciO/YrdC/YwlC family) [Balneicella halophila]|uniref:tRNA threonylcarbamoyl adenosine modification protein (Sua5/YciO/YrdC/YwlC family) n=1 Tax=Balneicella halophila TaxID=1537566 RepID=A0A7L4UQE4_BALHA|nr:L-threonylcarbamoyladenylate synthase [Balneicella halophila]PVX51970.1 tRNA threonylcarbamoyl adenosine modification protein (Sua5/YciO/YrdC/YwlC family) [Balneicella halophila]